MTAITNTNLYSVSVSVTSCTNSEVQNTNYTGFATSENPDTLLVFAISNGSFGMYADFD